MVDFIKGLFSKCPPLGFSVIFFSVGLVLGIVGGCWGLGLMRRAVLRPKFRHFDH